MNSFTLQILKHRGWKHSLDFQRWYKADWPPESNTWPIEKVLKAEGFKEPKQ